MKTLILHDEFKIGARNQCVGLAQALDSTTDIHPVCIRFPYGYLPEILWPQSLESLLVQPLDLSPGIPDIIMASGRRSIVPALLYKKKFPTAFLVLLQKPGSFKSQADAVIVPEHDGLENDAKTLTLLGNPHSVVPEDLENAVISFPELQRRVLGYTVVTILIGGPNKAFRFSPTHMHKYWEKLQSNLSKDPSLFYLVSFSRRTPQEFIDVMQAITHPRIYVWNGKGPNPYLAFLAFASIFVITADSVAMTSEAAATGKPIYLLPLDGGNAKFKRYHEALKRHGVTRIYAGQMEHWTYKPLKENQRAAKWILKKIKERISFCTKE